MQNPKLKCFLLGGVVLGPLLALVLLSLRGLGDRPDEDYVAVEKAAEGIRCPNGATMAYAPWGESGHMVHCQLNHGAFIAAERGRIVVRSEYAMGKLVHEKNADTGR